MEKSRPGYAAFWGKLNVHFLNGSGTDFSALNNKFYFSQVLAFIFFMLMLQHFQCAWKQNNYCKFHYRNVTWNLFTLLEFGRFIFISTCPKRNNFLFVSDYNHAYTTSYAPFQHHNIHFQKLMGLNFMRLETLYINWTGLLCSPLGIQMTCKPCLPLHNFEFW